MTIHQSGKRKRSYFETKAEAEKEWKSHCHRLKRFGSSSGDYRPEDHQELIEVRRIVPEVDLREIARFYRQHHPEGAVASTITEAVAEFLAHQKGKRLAPKYLDGVTKQLDRYALSFGDKAVSSITGNEVLEWLTGLRLAPRTTANYSDTLATFFNWCPAPGSCRGSAYRTG